MQRPKWLQRLRIPAQRTAEIVAVNVGNAEAAVPQAPEAPALEDADPSKHPHAAWRNTKLGFLHEELGDQNRMHRLNHYLAIMAFRRIAHTTLWIMASTTVSIGYVARTAGSGKDTELRVLAVIFIGAGIFAIIASISMAVLAQRQPGSGKKATGEVKGKTEQPPDRKSVV